MDLLDKLKLVNRSNIGVTCIYRSLLMEGKEPPIYQEVGNHIELTFAASPLHSDFLNLVKQVVEKGQVMDVDHLLTLHYLISHEEIATSSAAIVSQRNLEQARELLSRLANNMGLIDAIGRGRGRHYTLARFAYDMFKGSMTYKRKNILDKEAMKMRILSVLKD